MKRAISLLLKKPLKLICCSFLAVFIFTATPSTPTFAHWYHCIYGCSLVNSDIIQPDHADIIRTPVTEHIANEFNDHRDWLVNTFAREQVIPALQLFTEQMSVVAMQQAMIIGTFFDAKHQLETQRLLQELQVQAHKDYQPSTSFCALGTNVRSLGHSESVARYNSIAMSQRQLARHTGQVNMSGATGAEDDKKARWQQFTELYCDPQDNHWISGTADTGLEAICTSTDSNRINRDIDYTRAIENRRTLDVSRIIPSTAVADDVDTQSLGNNLYGHKILTRNISRSNIDDDDKPKLYMGLRSIAAKRAVAENSFNAIVGMKSFGSAEGFYGGGGIQTDQYLGAVLTELGIPEADAAYYLGLEDLGSFSALPAFSYYAQLEILAKKIYQNPDFYANLYDKPANVKRTSAALKAIDLMLDRAIYESQLRQEMAMSVLLSSRLRMNFEDIDKSLN